MINNVIYMTILMHRLQPPQQLHHAEHKQQQQQHACRPCIHFEIIKTLKPPVARKLAVGHSSV